MGLLMLLTSDTVLLKVKVIALRGGQSAVPKIKNCYSTMSKIKIQEAVSLLLASAMNLPVGKPPVLLNS